MKKVLMVLVLLLTSCTTFHVYHEDNMSIGMSKTAMVEEYENIAINLRKVHDGIQVLCANRQTKECEEIRHLYNQTRDVFIKGGNLAIEYINETDSKKKAQIYEKYLQLVKEFNVLWNSLIKKASEIGIGGIK